MVTHTEKPGGWICAPITETIADRFLAACDAAFAAADAVELRFDYLDNANLARVLSSLPAEFPKPVIATFRPRGQGGQRELSLDDRRAFWAALPSSLKQAIAFADFELDLVESFHNEEPPLPWSKVICSWHNFTETPTALRERYAQMAATPAAVVKIATQANRIADCLPLFDLLDRAEKPVIALGMSLPGLATRVLSLSRGALLTFGSLQRGAESAAGQPTVTELRGLYRAQRLTRASQIFGIIGNPVGHSRSPRMHNAALQALGLDGVYLPFAVDDAGAFLRDFVHPATRKLDWNLRGLSVTIPHKLAVLPHLDLIDAAALAVGAVNTIVVEDGKLPARLCGYNTDVAGAMEPLDQLLDVRGAQVAVLGAGGSARAVCFGLRARGAEVTVFARDAQKAAALAAEFGAQAERIEAFSGSEVVINCTPIGMHGHSEGQSPLLAEQLRGVRLVYDLIYTPTETALLQAARAMGCQTLGGLAMLLAQAGEQFRLWTGRAAPLEVMGAALSE